MLSVGSSASEQYRCADTDSRFHLDGLFPIGHGANRTPGQVRSLLNEKSAQTIHTSKNR